MKPEFTRPFNAEHAKEGAPYCCANGDGSTVIKWDCRGVAPLAGIVSASDADYPALWMLTGLKRGNNLTDIVMTPLGFIDGKPVFVGDEVIWPGHTDTIPAMPNWKPQNVAGCRWPVPAKVYPETGMTNRDMADAVGESHWPTSPDLYDRARRLINAALRHAIDSDAVVTKEDHEADLQRLGESLRDVAIQRDAARDMAIACSVRDQMADLIANSQNDVRAYCLERLDVDAIIAQIELDS